MFGDWLNLPILDIEEIVNKMKILCINTNGLHNDGITNSILSYYGHMNRDGMEIHVLKTKDVERGIVRRFEELGLVLKFTEYRNRPISYLIKTAKLIRSEKYDIVHTHGSSALLSLDLLAAKLGGCKVRIAHSRNTTCTHKNLDKALRPLFYALCTTRFACGKDAGRWLFGGRSFTVIKNGKDLNEFSFDPDERENIRNKYKWQDKTVIGHVGNFNYQKNHEFLINIFETLSKSSDNYILVLIGTGSEYLDRAKEQTKDRGLEKSIIYMGSINNVADILQGMDIMLLPSRFEGFPNVVLEWQAMGLPCIISDKITKECSVTELVQYISIDNGVGPWIEAIKEVVQKDRNADSKKANSALRDNGFEIERNSDELKSIYAQLISLDSE